jgi:hypothetical protein
MTRTTKLSMPARTAIHNDHADTRWNRRRHGERPLLPGVERLALGRRNRCVVCRHDSRTDGAKDG